jgi:hypothetical protein
MARPRTDKGISRTTKAFVGTLVGVSAFGAMRGFSDVRSIVGEFETLTIGKTPIGADVFARDLGEFQKLGEGLFQPSTSVTSALMKFFGKDAIEVTSNYEDVITQEIKDDFQDVTEEMDDAFEDVLLEEIEDSKETLEEETPTKEEEKSQKEEARKSAKEEAQSSKKEEKENSGGTITGAVVGAAQGAFGLYGRWQNFREANPITAAAIDFKRSSKYGRRGAIAGAVIGAVVGVALISLAIAAAPTPVGIVSALILLTPVAATTAFTGFKSGMWYGGKIDQGIAARALYQKYKEVGVSGIVREKVEGVASGIASVRERVFGTDRQGESLPQRAERGVAGQEVVIRDIPIEQKSMLAIEDVPTTERQMLAIEDIKDDKPKDAEEEVFYDIEDVPDLETSKSATSFTEKEQTQKAIVDKVPNHSM